MSRRVGVGAARAGGIVAPRNHELRPHSQKSSSGGRTFLRYPREGRRAPTLLAHAVHAAEVSSY